MASAVKPIPQGYHSLTPYLVCRGADRAIEFYKRAFGATEILRMPGPGGKIVHAELRIGDSVLMLCDEMSEGSAPSADSPARSSSIFLYVPDADAAMRAAVAGGARVDMPLENMFWGDRFGKLTDPFGHQWGVATHVEDVAPEELERRSRAHFQKAAAQG